MINCKITDDPNASLFLLMYTYYNITFNVFQYAVYISSTSASNVKTTYAISFVISLVSYYLLIRCNLTFDCPGRVGPHILLQWRSMSYLGGDATWNKFPETSLETAVPKYVIRPSQAACSWVIRPRSIAEDANNKHDTGINMPTLMKVSRYTLLCTSVQQRHRNLLPSVPRSLFSTLFY